MNQWLDALDGMAARRFNQCNAFGMVLDMVIDRASDAVFLAIIS
jgi:CDP-diacylglycerol--inositol 3-phosphatidyltransferase